jgi:uncharacterized membrane protein
MTQEGHTPLASAVDTVTVEVPTITVYCADDVWVVLPQEEDTRSCTVKNTGNQTIADIHVTITDSLGWGNTYTPTTLIPRLDPGDPVPVIVTGTAPLTGTGVLTLSVAAEAPEVTAMHTVSIKVQRFISAQIEAGRHHYVKPHEVLTFTKRVTNTGNVTETFRLTSTVKVREGVTRGWTITWTPNPIPELPPGDWVTATASVTHPTEAGATAVITTRVMTEGRSMPFASTIDTVTVRAEPTITVYCADNVWVVWPHQESTLSCAVENIGSQVVTNVYVMVDDALRWSDTYTYFTVTPTLVEHLAPGAKYNITVTGTSSPCVISGTTTPLTLTAAGNPSVTAKATATLQVGRSVTGVIFPRETYTLIHPSNLEPFTLTKMITNSGNFTTTFDLQYQDIYTGWSVVWKPISVTLAPCSFTITLGSVDSPAIAQGTTTLTTHLVAEGKIRDSSFDQVRVDEYFSATISPARQQHEASPDAVLTFTKRVTNTGNVTTTFRLTSTIDVTRGWTITWTPLSELAPGVSATYTASVSHPTEAEETAVITTRVMTEGGRTPLVGVSAIDTVTVRAMPTITFCCADDVWVVWPHQESPRSCTVENTSTQVIADVRVTVTDSLGWMDTYTPTLIPQLDPGDPVPVIVTGTAPLTGTGVLTLSVAAEAPAVTATHTVSIRVGKYVSAQIEAGTRHSVAICEKLAFTKWVTNTGNVTATFWLNSKISDDEWRISWDPNPLDNLGPSDRSASIATISPSLKVGAEVTISTGVTPTDGIISTSVDVMRTERCKVYLPCGLYCYPLPSIPSTPNLQVIENWDIDGDYDVCWDSVDYATYYVLKENETEIENFITETCFYFHKEKMASYEYRVKACNCNQCSEFSSSKEMEPWCEQESNNSGGDANGPLASNKVYYGRPNDPEDHFWFEPTIKGQIKITLTNYTGSGGWLLLYYKDYHVPADGSCKIKPGENQCLISDLGNRPPDIYYVRVYTDLDFNDSPYRLQLEFPSDPNRRQRSVKWDEGINRPNNQLRGGKWASER